jgi:hypothetical protein
MARGVIRKLVGSTTLGAGGGVAWQALNNAVPTTVDPGMSDAVQQAIHQGAANAQSHSILPIVAGTLFGLGVGVHNRNKERKAELNANLSNQFKDHK